MKPSLVLHPTQLEEKLFHYYLVETAEWKNFIHISEDQDKEIIIQTANPDLETLDAIAETNSIIRLVYNPKQTDPSSITRVDAWFDQHYTSCQRLEPNDEAIFELAISNVFPCELVDERSSLAVRYESGVELAERLTEIETDNVAIYLWWSNPLDGGYAYSIQVFDEHRIKVDQDDRVIGSNPLVLRRIDTTTLAPGRYSAQTHRL